MNSDHRVYLRRDLMKAKHPEVWSWLCEKLNLPDDPSVHIITLIQDSDLHKETIERLKV